MIIGIDIGGTFTDCVVLDDDGSLIEAKAHSTPGNFAKGAFTAIRSAASKLGRDNEEGLLKSAAMVLHSCTVGDNTLLTRSGSHTALVTTKGFGDTLRMMRGNITEGLGEDETAHLSALRKPIPLVEPHRTFEVAERVDARGNVLVPLEPSTIEQLGVSLKNSGAEAVAIGLLWSVANPVHEHALVEKLQADGFFVAASSDVAPQEGEFERTATTVFQAYIGQTIADYLRDLESTFRRLGLATPLLVMESYGGVVDVEGAVRNAVGTIESGPAAGVEGCRRMAALSEVQDAIVTDMGGTTFKVGLIRGGRVEKTDLPVFMRHRLYGNKVWMKSIGAGGGSIISANDDGSSIQVGPRGAGASPGPVAYLRGGKEPTLTDASLLLGYMNPQKFFGGGLYLDRQAADDSLAEVGGAIGWDALQVSKAAYRIATSQMADLIRSATVERGADPRRFGAFAIGGAAPTFAARYCAELGIGNVIVPARSAAGGALGLIGADISFEYARSFVGTFPPAVPALKAGLDDLRRSAEGNFERMGIDRTKIELGYAIGMKFSYQSHHVSVPISDLQRNGSVDADALVKTFQTIYESRFGPGSCDLEAPIETTRLEISATVEPERPTLSASPMKPHEPTGALRESRVCYVPESETMEEVPVFELERMAPGGNLQGPALIDADMTTIVVPPACRVAMDSYRNLRMELAR